MIHVEMLYGTEYDHWQADGVHYANPVWDKARQLADERLACYQALVPHKDWPHNDVRNVEDIVALVDRPK